MSGRAGTWLRRYLPAEAVSLLGALLAAHVAWQLSDQNPVLAALAGAWGETLAYYATMLVRELTANHGDVPLALRDLVLEFGVAEALDSLFVRPTLMYAAGQLVANMTAGVLLGKLASDVVFYVPTIAAYELRRRYLPRATV
jgi:hypothetical protein